MRIDLQDNGPVSKRARAMPQDAGLADVLALISREKHVPIRLLVHISRCRADTARARQLAMYLAHVVKGVSLTAIGSAFGRDRTTVSYACGLIEDLRDNPQFDAELDRLEGLLLGHGDRP